MARADLSSLLGRLPDEPTFPVEQPQPELVIPGPGRSFIREVDDGLDRMGPDKAQALRVRRSQRRGAAEAAAQTSEPSYLHFVRKDTRLREDQLEQLTKESRRLNRAKRNTGVRITDNTLIRVAVDLLLARIENASGDDEAAILGSLL
jgi:hypothetical protein